MPRQSRRSALPEEHSIGVYAAPSNLGSNKSGIGEKLPFLIAGIIILLLVVVIAFLANGVGSKATSSAQQSTPMNITGLPESSPSGSSSNASSNSESSDSQSTTETTTKRLEPLPLRPLLRTRSRRAKRRMSKSMKVTHAWLPKICRAARLTATT